MNKKKGILSIMLVLALVASLILPPAQTTALAENIQTLTIEDAAFYEKLKSCIKNNDGALQASDDEKQLITLDLNKITSIQMMLTLDITGNNFKDTFETLFRECTNLKTLRLRKCNLRGIDFSGMDNRGSLTELYLTECNLGKIPDLTLPNLKTFCISEDDLSGDGACDSLTKTKLPLLNTLWLDECRLSHVDFIQNLGKFRSLSLANNQLTDDAIAALTDMENLSELKTLELGARVHIALGGSYAIKDPSGNRFTNYAGLASLSESFSELTTLELSGLGITSIQAFVGIKNSPKINFEYNGIMDCTGLTTENNFDLSLQRSKLMYDELVVGQEIAIPELVKRILDPNDILYSSEGLTYTNCHLSEDGTKIVIDKIYDAYLGVVRGKLNGSKISFIKKQIPSYTIPDNLTASVGDTLVSVILPKGFSWKDPAYILEEEGSHTFQAVYTPADTDKYIIVDNIAIPVTVTAKISPTPKPTQTAKPTPTPKPTQTAKPTPTPEPTQTAEPTPTSKPTQTAKPSPTPKPTQTAEPSPTPEIPASEAPTSTPPVMMPTVKPDESKLTGNQIEKRTDLPNLLAMGKQKGKNGIRLTWNKWNGCSGYEVYWSYCDGKQNFQKLKTVKKNGNRVCVHKKLKLTRAYKYYIATYQLKNGRKYYLSKSSSIHVAMKQEKHTNVKKIKLNKKKLALKSNETFQIKATAIKENKKKKLLNHERIFRYYTGNKEVAAVTKNGKIKAKKQGICTIFVIANNGVAKTIKLTVK